MFTMATTVNFGAAQREVPAPFVERLYRLWPWLKGVPAELSDAEMNTFYELTYAFGEDKWGDRLEEGADDDESQREFFMVLLCLEFGFDGSKPSRPGLWAMWRQLHKLVICPSFKARKPEEVPARYISWPSKTFTLDEGLVRAIWHKVYDTNDETAEEAWIGQNFHAWMLADRRHFAEPTGEPVKAVPLGLRATTPPGSKEEVKFEPKSGKRAFKFEPSKPSSPKKASEEGQAGRVTPSRAGGAQLRGGVGEVGRDPVDPKRAKVMITTDCDGDDAWDEHQSAIDEINRAFGLDESGHNGGDGHFWTTAKNVYNLSETALAPYCAKGESLLQWVDDVKVSIGFLVPKPKKGKGRSQARPQAGRDRQTNRGERGSFTEGRTCQAQGGPQAGRGLRCDQAGSERGDQGRDCSQDRGQDEGGSQGRDCSQGRGQGEGDSQGRTRQVQTEDQTPTPKEARGSAQAQEAS